MPPLRQKPKFDGGGNVVLVAWKQQRIRKDMLKLEERFYRDSRWPCDGVGELIILPLSASWHVVFQNDILLPGKIEGTIRRSPVPDPRLQGYALAPNRVSQEIRVIGISARVIEVPVVEVAVILKRGAPRTC